MSQQSLAGDGVSAGYVSLIESGKRTPSPAVLTRLAGRLGVPVEELADAPPAPTTAACERARVEVNFARLALSNGDPAQAIACLAKLRLDEVDPATASDAALVLAESLQQTGKLDRAVGVLETLLDRCRREGSWLPLATAASVLAIMYIEAGDVVRSAEVADRALDDVRAAGLEGTEEHVRLGSVFVASLIERGDLLHAARFVAELIEVADRVGTTRARGSVYWTAAVVAHDRGQLAHAVRLTDRAVALLAEQENSRDLPRLRLHYAWLLLIHEPPRAVEALRQLDAAEADPTLAGSRLDLGTAAIFRGRAHLVIGDIDDAAEQAARALTLLGASQHVERVRALTLLGDVGLAQEDSDLCLESLVEAEQVLTGMKDSRTVARLWRELGDSWRDLGRTTAALTAYDRSFRLLGVTPRPTGTGRPSATGTTTTNETGARSAGTVPVHGPR